jgi:hypothetical protein
MSSRCAHSSSAIVTTRGHSHQSFESVHFSTMSTAPAKRHRVLVMAGFDIRSGREARL